MQSIITNLKAWLTANSEQNLLQIMEIALVLMFVSAGWKDLKNSEKPWAKKLVQHIRTISPILIVLCTVAVWLVFSGLIASYVFLVLLCIKVEEMRMRNRSKTRW